MSLIIYRHNNIKTTVKTIEQQKEYKASKDATLSVSAGTFLYSLKLCISNFAQLQRAEP